MPTARSAFTLVEASNKLILAGDSRNIDLYDIDSNTYSVCAFTLPDAGAYLSLPKSENRLLYFHSDKLWDIDMESNSSSVVCSIPNGKWRSHFPLSSAEADSFSRGTTTLLCGRTTVLLKN